MSPPFDDLDPKRTLTKPGDGAPQWRDAWLYKPSQSLVHALRLALHLRQPLLLTGTPGCGKTSAAWWAAMNLGLSEDDVVAATVRSDATAQRLRYEFDAVRHFHEATVAKKLARWPECIRKGPLWLAFERAAAGRLTVLLLDEIDKAPRDLPNDLLHEFDTFGFEVPELAGEGNGAPTRIPDPATKPLPRDERRLLVVFTSNGERQLPDAFLRRCLHHHVEMDRAALLTVVQARIAAGELRLSQRFAELAVTKFEELLRRRDLEHPAGPSELLVWLRAVARFGGVTEDELEALELGALPHLEALLKTHGDRARLRGQGP